MQRDKVKKEMLVAVNKLDDGQVYQVKKVEGHQVELIYKMRNGQVCSGSWIDCSVLRAPTKKQLEHSLLNLY